MINMMQGTNSDVLSSTTPLNMTQTSFSFKSPNQMRRSNQGRIAQALLQNRTLSIEELHLQLSKIIDSMDNRIQKVINRHDDQFLTAYRAQMIKVQRQLAYLKQKANEQQFSLRRDQRINALENSLVWFRNEAIRLGKEKEDNKEQYKLLQVKYDNMIEDKNFLQEQAIASKKQIKSMRQALQRLRSEILHQPNKKFTHQSARGSQKNEFKSFGRQKLSLTASNYNTSVESYSQNQKLQNTSSIHKNSLFTQRDRNNSITEDVSTTTPKLPKLSPSPLTQDSISNNQGYSSDKRNSNNNFPPIQKSSSFDAHNKSTSVSNAGEQQLKTSDNLKFLGQANFMPGIPEKKQIISTSQNEIAINRSRMGLDNRVVNAQSSMQRREIQSTDIQDSEYIAGTTNNLISIESPKINLDNQKFNRQKKRNYSPSSMRYQNEEDDDQEQQYINKIEQTQQPNQKQQQLTNRQIALIPQKQLPAPQITQIQPQTKLSSFVFQLLDAGVDRNQIIYQVDNYMISQQHRVNSLLTTLRSKLQAKQNYIINLKNQNNQYLTKRNLLQDIFFNCVEQVRLDAFNRQQLNMPPLLTARKRQQSTKIQHRKMSSSQNFSADQKRKVIQEFLNTDQVINAMHSVLFKKKKQNDLGKTDIFRSSNRTNQMMAGGGEQRRMSPQRYQQSFQPSATNTFARRTINLNGTTDINSTGAVLNSSFNKSLSLARVDTREYLEKMKDPFKNVPTKNINNNKKLRSIGKRNSRGLSFPEQSFKEIERLVGQQQNRRQGKLNHTIKDGVLMLKKQ